MTTIKRTFLNVFCHINTPLAMTIKKGEGSFDFGKLTRRLSDKGYDGAYIVDLYRDNYGSFEELKRSADRMAEFAGL